MMLILLLAANAVLFLVLVFAVLLGLRGVVLLIWLAILLPLAVANATAAINAWGW